MDEYIEHPKIVKEISDHDGGICLTVSFSPDQTMVCSSGAGRVVVLTNLENFESKEVKTHKGPVDGSDFSPDGRHFATCSYDQTVLIWNSSDFSSENSTVLHGHSHYIFAVRFFRNDSTKVVSGGCDQMVRIWSIEKKKEISTLGPLLGNVYSVDTLPNDQTIASGDKKRQVVVWDLRSGKEVKFLCDHENTVSSVRFHPGAFLLASGSWDNSIKIYDYRTFKILRCYQQHAGDVNSVSFHPSGKCLISGSDDKSVKIFDVSPSKKVIHDLKGCHKDWVRCVEFSPNGNFFVSGSSDSKAYLWSFPLGRKMMVSNRDEEERVRYLFERVGEEEENENILYFCDGKQDEKKRKKTVLRIRICDYVTLYCYKSLFHKVVEIY